MFASFRRHVICALVGAGFAVVTFGTPTAIMAATTPPPLPVSPHPCVNAGVLAATPSCEQALAQASSRWPGAQVSLLGVTSGNGSWIIPAGDGMHFDLVTVRIELGSKSSTSNATSTTAFRPVQDAFALSVVASGSGHLNLSGCTYIEDWNGYVKYDTSYGAHLEMDLTGHLNVCNAAYTDTLTPVSYGAGSWTYSSGIIGNGSTKTNPWINWYGSLWGCCSDTVLERYYMDAWGNWSWTVYH